MAAVKCHHCENSLLARKQAPCGVALRETALPPSPTFTRWSACSQVGVSGVTMILKKNLWSPINQADPFAKLQNNNSYIFVIDTTTQLQLTWFMP